MTYEEALEQYKAAEAVLNAIARERANSIENWLQRSMFLAKCETDKWPEWKRRLMAATVEHNNAIATRRQ